MKNSKSPLMESAKEAARVGLLAALGVLAESLMSNTFNWKLTGILAAVTALKAVDKYIHTDKTINAKGLLPF